MLTSASVSCVCSGKGGDAGWVGQFSVQVLPGIEISPAKTVTGAHSKMAANTRLLIALSSERETQERQ